MQNASNKTFLIPLIHTEQLELNLFLRQCRMRLMHSLLAIFRSKLYKRLRRRDAVTRDGIDC